MSRLLADVTEMFQEQRQYRELLFQVTYRDLLLRYKQTAMGFAWAVFMPLVNTAVFAVIFMRVAPLDVGMPYPLYAFSGLLVWNFFASSLKFAVNSLTSNTGLVTKVYFPREVLPVSCVLVSTVDFAVASLVLVGMMVYYGVGFHWTVVLLPIVVLVHLLFTVGIALLLSMANLFYRDVKYLFEIVISIWMFLSSTVVPVERAGGKLAAIMQWNPMLPIIDAYRDVLIRGQVPPLLSFGGAALVSVLVCGVSWLMFHRAEFEFAENV
ncbi:MAG: ABC transporter permease [Acidobacteriota bacterium]